jgi:hypothetical protein
MLFGGRITKLSFSLRLIDNEHGVSGAIWMPVWSIAMFRQMHCY